jgi:hypothetical protein
VTVLNDKKGQQDRKARFRADRCDCTLRVPREEITGRDSMPVLSLKEIMLTWNKLIAENSSLFMKGIYA